MLLAVPSNNVRPRGSFTPIPSSAPPSQTSFFPHQHSRRRPKLSLQISADQNRFARTSQSANSPRTVSMLSPTSRNTQLNATMTRPNRQPIQIVEDSPSSSSSSEDESENKYRFRRRMNNPTSAHQPTTPSTGFYQPTAPLPQQSRRRVRFEDNVREIPGRILEDDEELYTGARLRVGNSKEMWKIGRKEYERLRREENC